VKHTGICFVGDVSAQGSSFTFGFMDITPDKDHKDEAGFIQLFAVSNNVTTLLAQVVITSRYKAKWPLYATCGPAG